MSKDIFMSVGILDVYDGYEIRTSGNTNLKKHFISESSDPKRHFIFETSDERYKLSLHFIKRTIRIESDAIYMCSVSFTSEKENWNSTEVSRVGICIVYDEKTISYVMDLKIDNETFAIQLEKLLTKLIIRGEI